MRAAFDPGEPSRVCGMHIQSSRRPSRPCCNGGRAVRGSLPSPSGGMWVSMVGVGLEPSSGLRVRKKRKETTIIEINTIYSPELLNGWDLHMARPRERDRGRERERKTDRRNDRQITRQPPTRGCLWKPASINHSQHDWAARSAGGLKPPFNSHVQLQVIQTTSIVTARESVDGWLTRNTRAEQALRLRSVSEVMWTLVHMRLFRVTLVMSSTSGYCAKVLFGV